MTIKEYLDKVFQDKIHWCSNPVFKIKLNAVGVVATNVEDAVVEISCDISDPRDFCPLAKQ
jgi:hypothetical protein